MTAPEHVSATPALDHANLYGIQSAPPAPPAPPVAESETTGKKGKKKKKKGKGQQDPELVPMSAAGSLDNRLTNSAGLAATPPPPFTVEGGNVVPKQLNGANKKKKRKSALSAGSFAGGRWKVYAFRGGAMLALGIIMLAGIMSMIGSGPAEPEDPPGAKFPVSAAQGYTAQFVQIYYTWNDESQEARDARTEALKNFFVDNAEQTEREAWNAAGKQEVRSVTPGKVKLIDDDHANLQFGLLLDLGTAFPYQCVDVPVYANRDNGTFAILGMPSFVPCSITSKADVTDIADEAEPDEEGTYDTEIEENLEKFFTAYGVDDREELRTWRTSDSNVTSGLSAPLVFVNFDKKDIYLVEGESNKRTVLVRVRWSILGSDLAPRGEVSSDYIVTVRMSQDNETWQVEELQSGIPSSKFAPSENGPPAKEEEDAQSDVDDSGSQTQPSQDASQPAG